MRNNTSIKAVIDKVVVFRNERDWEKFHNGKDLAICLNCESSELLELFLWKDSDQVNKEKLKEELADVLYSAFLLIDKYELDVESIISQKLLSNAQKYPVEKSKGSNKKYDEL
jgi:NTP pyrophosphatase (non-canonical NTP hydrolase)